MSSGSRLLKIRIYCICGYRKTVYYQYYIIYILFEINSVDLNHLAPE